MAQLLKLPRAAIGLLTLTAAAPVVAMEWRDLASERDQLRAENQLLRQQVGSATAARGGGEPDEGQVAYAGDFLYAGSATELSWAREEQTVLATEAAALRRQLERTRAELASWERAEGQLDLSLAESPPLSRGVDTETVRLIDEGQALRRRLKRVDRDLVEVQLERDEALAELRREMFTSLLYSSIIGECGHRNGKRAFEKCSETVRTALYPHWDRFQACIRDYNAVPAYTQTQSAQEAAFAVRLDRGAVLMCDPRMPEGGL